MTDGEQYKIRWPVKDLAYRLRPSHAAAQDDILGTMTAHVRKPARFQRRPRFAHSVIKNMICSISLAYLAIRRRHGVLDGIRIPLRPHFGVIGVAPREPGLVDSVPPAYFGGNLDNWRLGKGAAVYLPVSVPEALLSIGDPHAA